MLNKKKEKSFDEKKDLREYIAKQNLDESIINEYEEDTSSEGYDVYENEGIEAEDAIEKLAHTDFKHTNVDQRQGIQILQHLTESNEETANEFMRLLSDKYTEIAKDMGII